MRFRVLNAASSRMEEAQVDSGNLFLKIDVYRPAGEGYLSDYTRALIVPLDELVGLVAERVAILEAAGGEDEAPKRKRKPVAA